MQSHFKTVTDGGSEATTRLQKYQVKCDYRRKLEDQSVSEKSRQSNTSAIMQNGAENQFIIELCPPLSPEDIPAYFKKFAHLLNLTSSFSISSHPVGQISGFERSYNLARYLLDQNPDLDILFHITCNDLNRDNILARLTLLKELRIRRILVVTGESYPPPDHLQGMHFIDSRQLLSCIAERFNWFESIGIAGYPGADEDGCVQKEMLRLKSKMCPGVDRIYTQCVFAANELKKFRGGVELTLGPSLEVVPSVALFGNIANLERVSRLTRVKPDAELMESLARIEFVEEQRAFSRDFIINLCRQLSQAQSRVCLIICTFGLFDLADEVLRDLVRSEDNAWNGDS